MYKVTLLKGNKGKRVWQDTTQEGAESRAYVLAALHGNVEVEKTSTGYSVNASQWYTKRETK